MFSFVFCLFVFMVIAADALLGFVIARDFFYLFIYFFNVILRFALPEPRVGRDRWWKYIFILFVVAFLGVLSCLCLCLCIGRSWVRVCLGAVCARTSV